MFQLVGSSWFTGGNKYQVNICTNCYQEFESIWSYSLTLIKSMKQSHKYEKMYFLTICSSQERSLSSTAEAQIPSTDGLKQKPENLPIQSQVDFDPPEHAQKNVTSSILLNFLSISAKGQRVGVGALSTRKLDTQLSFSNPTFKNYISNSQFNLTLIIYYKLIAILQQKTESIKVFKLRKLRNNKSEQYSTRI